MRLLCTFVLLFITSVASAAPIKVAVFEGDGVGKSCTNLLTILDNSSKIQLEVSRVTTADIVAGKLDEFDVLIHPGGSGSKQGNDLGEDGRQQVRQFVSQGGGFLGVCAGAYLATNDYTWSLNLIDAKVVDRKHWARGTGTVQLELSPSGQDLFKAKSSELEIFYGQGPLLARREWDDPKTPDYESLAIYGSEIAKNGAPNGIMKGTSAAVRCDYGKGRVFCFSAHPELTEGLHYLIPTVVQWLKK
ncbi:MAG: biofilm PGA synthesis protein PgaB [Planctomycetaceae bacterium]|nr:biofilm PGA synthesis protein PgaB [Planctomycetaceae bacterium]MBT4844800.1 biofilm PGA synthesis protein PgaB [Planctomycetaceae bacterium]MBT5600046.1 biofilm PGA synthesis protein PgaB [Planctomycetaceae bacterium]MBT6846944.1 biofilm PGA synthesis protein PgaB [Planctomycetaceae bacterium]